MNVFNLLIVLAVRSHSQDVTSSVQAIFSNWKTFGNNTGSHSLIACAHDSGSSDFPFHLNFHLSSSWSMSSGEGRSSSYSSIAPEMVISCPAENTDGTRPMRVEEVLVREENHASSSVIT